MAPTATTGRLVVSVLLAQPWTSTGALSVFPYESDGIILKLRSSVMLDERDLLEPAPPRTCSSFSDGPFCSRFPTMPAATSLSALNGASAQYVVDGILSHWLQSRHSEAFAWSRDTMSTFSGQISRVIAETLSRRLLRSATSAGHVITSVKSRSKSRCFRLALDHLPPWQVTVPSNFSAGLSGAADVTWEGRWEAKADRLTLQTALGYIRFARPVVACRLVVSVPVATEDEDGHVWGRDALICGRLKGREQWCTSMDQAAAATRSMDASMATSEQGELQADVGNGLRSVDELAVLAAPPGGLAMLKLEVSATPSAGSEEQPTDSSAAPAERHVVLLRRGQGAALVEPTLAVVARDAAVWDMNEVLQQNMLLRTVPSGNSGRLSLSRRPVAAKLELASFQQMLQGLKSRTLPLPPGVTLQKLKREVGVLVASTKELQDDDVLLHTKIESLLQKRLREKRLDALIAVQAAWRRKHKATELEEVVIPLEPEVSEATDVKMTGLETQSFDLQLDKKGKVQFHIAKVDVASMKDLVNKVMASARGGGNMPSSIGGGGREGEAEDVGEGAKAASKAGATAVGSTIAAEEQAAADDREDNDGGKGIGRADEIAKVMARMFSEAGAADDGEANDGDKKIGRDDEIAKVVARMFSQVGAADDGEESDGDKKNGRHDEIAKVMARMFSQAGAADAGEESDGDKKSGRDDVIAKVMARMFSEAGDADDGEENDGDKKSGRDDLIAKTFASMFPGAGNVQVVNLGNVDVANLANMGVANLANMEVANLADATEGVQEMLGPLLQQMLSGANQASKNSLDIDAVQDVPTKEEERDDLPLEL